LRRGLRAGLFLLLDALGEPGRSRDDPIRASSPARGPRDLRVPARSLPSSVPPPARSPELSV
jgi:hypothetical protein